MARHIAGVDDRADDLSRNRLSSFRSKVPEADDDPTVIPLWLQQLGWVPGEWTNKTWVRWLRDSFGSPLPPATRRTYCSAQGRYLTYCAEEHTQPLPTNEDILCRFIAWMFAHDLSHQTMKSYLSAVRHLQIMSGLGDPFVSEMLRLQYVLKGARIEMSKSTPGAKRSRLPITPAFLPITSCFGRQCVSATSAS